MVIFMNLRYRDILKIKMNKTPNQVANDTKTEKRGRNHINHPCKSTTRSHKA